MQLLLFVVLVVAHPSLLVPKRYIENAGTPRLSVQPFQLKAVYADNQTQVDYNVTHSENVLSLEHTQGLHTVYCRQDSTMQLVFRSSSSAMRFFQLEEIRSRTAVIVGGSHFGCVQPSSGELMPVSVRLTANSTAFVDLSVVTLRHVHPAMAHHVFKHASVAITHPLTLADEMTEDESGCPAKSTCQSCISSLGGKACATDQCKDCSASCVNCVAGGGGTGCGPKCVPGTCDGTCGQCVRAGGGISCNDKCSGCGNDCLTCLENGGGAACDDRCNSQAPETNCNLALVAIGRCVFSTGGAKNFPSKGFNFDYSGKTLLSSGTAKVTCDTCTFKLDPIVLFNLEISNNQLISAGASLKGNFGSTVRATASVSGAYTKSLESVVAKLSGPSIAFFVGAFPVTITSTFPISAGVSINAKASASTTATASAVGAVAGGLLFANNALSPLYDRSLSFSFAQPTYKAAASLSATVYLLPQLSVTVVGVISATTTVKPFVDFEASGNGVSKCPGICQANTQSCSSPYRSGLCPGAGNIQCCPVSTPSCDGQCQQNSLPCAQPYQTGLCPGAANIQCCPSSGPVCINADLFAGYSAFIEGELGVQLGPFPIGPKQRFFKKQLGNDKKLVWTYHPC